MDNGTIKGNHVGMTVVNAQLGSKKGACAVAVTPKYFTYKEPIMDWGMTKSDLISKKGNPYTTSTDGKTIYYQQAEKIFEGYSFENNVLVSSSVMLPLTSITVSDFLTERYELGYYETRNNIDMYYFFNSMNIDDASLCVVLGVSSSQNLILVHYSKFNVNNNAPTRIHEMIDLQL